MFIYNADTIGKPRKCNEKEKYNPTSEFEKSVLHSLPDYYSQFGMGFLSPHCNINRV